MITNVNGIANYDRYHIRDIHKTIRLMSPEQKQGILDEIQLHKAACGLSKQEYDREVCERVERLLKKESE